MTLYECSGILWAICDDLMDSIENRHHSIALKILRWELLPTWKIADKVPQRITPCNYRQRGKLRVSVQIGSCKI